MGLLSMKKSLLIFYTFLFCFHANAQDIRPEVLLIVEKIAEYNQITSEYPGLSFEVDPQYARYKSLQKEATTQELKTLIAYNNAAVKGYASFALADRKYPALVLVFDSLLQSDDSITVFLGCMFGKTTIAKQFYFHVDEVKKYGHKSTTDSLFYAEQLAQMDSLILYKYSNRKSLLYFALNNNNANPKTHDQIRDLALIKKSPETIKALAKYQSKEDIPVLKQFGAAAFWGLEEFPDPAFWDFILSYKNVDSIGFSYVRTVIPYKNAESAQILRDILPQLDNEEIEILSRLLTENYCADYHNLLVQIWEQHAVINYQTAQYIIQDNPNRAALSFAIGLRSSKKSTFLSNKRYRIIEDRILPLMLGHIVQYKKEELSSVCLAQIKYADYKDLIVVLSYIKTHNLVLVNQALLSRLGREHKAYEIYHITETILSFGDPSQKTQVEDILRRNQAYWDTGKWSKSFREELFERYEIGIK
jgi:hypothetical protein